MVTRCPHCQTEQTIQTTQVDHGSKTRCEHCQAPLKINLSLELEIDGSPETSPSTNEALPPAQTHQNTVLVCIDGEATREVLRVVLETSGFNMLDIPSGIASFMSMKLNAPKIALIDAGFTDMPGTELISQIKNNPALSDIPLIMVTSMFEKNTKYREEAPDLYGADDFIDRHQIKKNLLAKIEKLLHKKKHLPRLLTNRACPEIRPESDPKLMIEQPGADEIAQAEKFAEKIVGDIVLFNHQKAEEGIQNGAFYDLLEAEIEEGRQLFKSKTSQALWGADYYEQALESFVSKKTAEYDEALDQPHPDCEKETELFQNPEVDQPNAPEVSEPSQAPVEASSEVSDAQQPVDPPAFTLDEDNAFLAPMELDDVFQDSEEVSNDGNRDQLESFVEQSEEAFENAKQIAKEIILDLVQKNEDKMETGMGSDRFYDVLGDEIMEGRQLFELKAPAYFDTSIYEDEIDRVLEESGACENVSEIESEDSGNAIPEPLQESISTPSFESVPDDSAFPEQEEAGDIFKAMEEEAKTAIQDTEADQSESDSEAWHPPLVPDPQNADDIFKAMEEEAEAAVAEAGNPEEPSLPAFENPDQNPGEGDSEEVKNAKRLAKIIVSDITIYNEAKVEEGLENNTFYEVLEEEIQEGRVLFKTRVSDEIFNSGLYEDALETYIQQKKPSTDSAPSSEAPENFEKQAETLALEGMPLETEALTYETPSIDFTTEDGHENGYTEETQEEKEAKRLARIIVSDIVIYNENKADEGIQSGTFYELLEDEIKEARSLFESRVSQKTLATRDYMKEAFEAYIKQRAASLS
ncbi:MAG: PleD family two-component system response regulator [Nitrospiria bacterium]